MKKLTIIIPSRKQEKQIEFLRRATDSARNQSIANQFQLTFLIGVDKGCTLDPLVSKSLGVICIESDGTSQAAALNGAIRVMEDGYVAFLEDDDRWMPEYLNFAMKALALSEFVSSTQAEVDEDDELLRINDFPTPSGWIMDSSVLKKVGEFNEEYRFHLDNEWLGRLSELKIKRIHMAESTAPIVRTYINPVRPWLLNVLNLSGGYCSIARHQSPYPLVKRMVHSKSGMAQIAASKELLEISDIEVNKLIKRFGRRPW